MSSSRGIPVADRFAAKVCRAPSGCWIWLGRLDHCGYGQFGKRSRSHRWAYEHFVGPIPPGYQVDHLCRVRRCANPMHLEAVTQQVNIALSEVGSPQRWRRHCPKNHPYDAANTHIKKTGARHCRACNRERERIRRAQRQGGIAA